MKAPSPKSPQSDHSRSRPLSEGSQKLFSEMDDDIHSSDTDREDELVAEKIKKAMKLEEERKRTNDVIKRIESELRREKDTLRIEELQANYNRSTCQIDALESQIKSIMSVGKDTPTASLRICQMNTGALSTKKLPWVRAMYDYKPVGKKGHTFFSYDEIIEVLDDNVSIVGTKKEQKMDFASFLNSYEDRDEETEEVKIMRGRVIGSSPLRVGLFPSNYVQDVQKKTGDYSRPDEKVQKTLLGMVRGQVSKKKRRFMAEGFDLDLSYITPQMIAMGIPASDMSAFYRNNLDEVIRFLEHFHKDHFQLYNLCDDRSYPTKKFHGRVVQYGFEDHNPCPFDMMEPFCAHLQEYLEEDEKNVAAIHCKAGKGRTGLMISAYLIYNYQHQDSYSALRFFAVKRTKNCKGVTIPSQMRYVHYFRRYLQGKRSGKKKIPREQHCKLLSIRMDPKPKHMEQGTCWFAVDMFNTQELKGVNRIKEIKSTDRIDLKDGAPPPNAVLKRLVKSFKKLRKVSGEDEGKGTIFDFEKQSLDMEVTDDVRVTLIFRARYSVKKKKIFQFWFNTRFLESDLRGHAVLQLNKSQIDKLCKDLKHTTVPEDFKVTVKLQIKPN